MIKKNPFLTFLAVVGSLILGTLWFIQSPQFARVFKRAIARYIPADLGMEGDFSEFAIRMFPPALSIREPKVVLAKRNAFSLPEGSSVTAERLDLIFRPLQMFSGKIRVNEVVVVNGDIRLKLDQKAAPKPRRRLKPDLGWDQLLQIRADEIALENSRLVVESVGDNWKVEAAGSMRIAHRSGEDGLAYQLELNLNELTGSLLSDVPLLRDVKRVHGKAILNAKGATLEAFSVAGEGFELTSTGTVKGDLLDPKQLLLDAQLAASGDLGTAAGIAEGQPRPARKNGADKAPSLDGQFRFDGKARADLLKVASTLRAEGSVMVAGLRYRDWRADEVMAEGSWSAAASGRGGEIAIRKALLRATERERSQGAPAHGGRIEVGAFRVDLGSAASGSPIRIPLQLHRAHLHWLAAPAVKAVYPLSFRISGPVDASFIPERKGQPWTIQATLKLALSDFILDNLKLDKVRHQKKILNIPRINLDGGIVVDATALRPNALTVFVDKSRFRAGGKVDFKTGYDLTANGAVQLQEVGQIAEADIRGEGMLAARIHGPASRVLVDFDAELKDASYLGLQLGDVRGRITYDDGPTEVLFSQVGVSRGSTRYTVNGKLAAEGEGSIALDIAVPQGNVIDFSNTFENLTKDIWWYPRTLGGPVTGEARVFGGLDLSKLQVRAKFTGTNWDYLGERFKKAAVEGGYDGGRYFVSEFHATKQAGKIDAAISFDPEGEIAWSLSTRDFTMSDLDLFARLDVPVRGNLRIDSSGQGRPGAIESQTAGTLSQLSVRGVPMAESRFLLRTAGGAAKAEAIALGGQGLAEFEYDFRQGSASRLKAEMRSLDFSPILLLLNPRTIQDPALTGLVSGTMNLAFKSGQIERATGRMTLSEYRLEKSGASFRLVEPVGFDVRDGTFELPELSIQGKQGVATLSLKGDRGRLDGDISGDLDCSIAEFLSPSILRAGGLADLDFSIGGTIKEPLLLGRADLSGSSLKVNGLESVFENISGAFLLKQNTISVQNMQGDLAGGRVTGNGSIQVFADRYPSVSLGGRLDRAKLKVYPFQYATVHGDLRVRGDKIPYSVEGEVTIDSALSREKMMAQRQAEGAKAAQYTPPATSRSDSGYPRFKLKIDVAADRGIMIQNDLLDVEAKGRFTVVNTLEAPRIVGTGELITGRMLFKDRVFVIQSASADFDSPTVINPRFNLTAHAEVNDVKIQLYASGRADKPRIELSSSPNMPESELLSLLALGVTSSDSKRLSPADRIMVERGEAASLILHSLDFNREVQSKTGIQINIDESVNNFQGSSIFRPQSQNESAAAPKLVIRRKIGKNLDLSYGSTVGVGTNNQKEVNAEFQLIPGLSVIGVYDFYGAADTQSTDRESYGIDLKVQRRFK